jgi:hypothetical protein
MKKALLSLILLSMAIFAIGCSSLSNASTKLDEVKLVITNLELDEEKHEITATGTDENDEKHTFVLNKDTDTKIMWDDKELTYENLEGQIVYSGVSAQEHVQHIDYAVASFDEDKNMATIKVKSKHAGEGDGHHDHGDEEDGHEH